MNRRMLIGLAATIVLLSLPVPARADAQADLNSGRVALQEGNLDKALPLLVSAAQGLPQSVDAHVSLAQAYLRLGRLEEAIKAYQDVLKLSPQHGQAKRIVEALSGQRATFAQKLATAQALMDAQEYSAAMGVLQGLLKEAADPAQKTAARLLRAECALWSNSLHEALADALRIVKEGGEPVQVGQAKVIGGLAYVGLGCVSGYSRAQAEQALALLKDIGQLPLPWSVRAEVANVFAVDFEQNPQKAAEISGKYIALMAAIPASPWRNEVQSRLTESFAAIALRRLENSDAASTLAILWPMVCDGPAPGADMVLKPIAIKGGWLSRDPVGRTCRMRVADALSAVARAERAKEGQKATLLGYWLAAAVLLDLDPSEDLSPDDRLLALGGELASVSHPIEGRKTGQPLSRADDIQYEIILKVAQRLTDAARRQALVSLITCQLTRYEKAGDLETGLARFVKVQDAADAKSAPKVELVGAPASWSGPSHQHVCAVLGGFYDRLGAKAFRQAAATLDAAANSAPNRFDRAALVLYGRMSPKQGPGDPGLAGAQKIFDRYASTLKWTAVETAMSLFYAEGGEDAAWALASLKVRRTIVEEDKLLNARKALGDKLAAPLAEALAEVKKMVPAAPESAQRQRAISLAQSLVTRYEALDRGDLAEAVIAALAEPIPEWALWARAELVEHKAAAALARLAAQFEGGAKLKLNPLHVDELKLLEEILAKHPLSPYAPASVGRIVQISSAYRDYKAYEPASAVLADFIKAHPKSSVSERMQYHLVQVAMTKAAVAFGERKDKEKTPEKLSAEHAAAVDALAAFLKDNPNGDYAPAAAGDLFAISHAYGQTGAWPVSRGVLARFSAALPDFKDPHLLKFLQAATYLGELDRAHGLQLLRLPVHAVPAGGPAGTGGAMGLAMWESDKLDGLETGEKQKDGRGYFAHAATQPAGARRDLEYAKRLSEPTPSPALPPAGRPYSEVGESLRLRPAEDIALAAIRRSEQANMQRLAMMQDQPRIRGGQEGRKPSDIVLPSGPVLSEAEMKRQDASADAAYAILVGLIKDPALVGKPLAPRAREEVLWMLGFFEGQSRPDRATAMIEKFLTDQPDDTAKVALSFRAVRDQLAWAGIVQPADRIDQAWVDQRHQRYEQARTRLAAFLKDHAEHKDWVHTARLLVVESYRQEAERVASVTAVRAGGLLARAAQELLKISNEMPEHPQVGEVPARLWEIAARLEALQQHEQSVHVLGQLPIRFPTDAHALQAVQRIAELYADRLNSPLRAVETYQEYLSLAGDREDVRTRIFNMGSQLAGQKRYLEALHVLGVFVDSFPTDPRAPQALLAIGQTHLANEAWHDATTSYRRILGEYPGAGITPQVQLAIAECQINLSEWKAARKTYEDYLQQYGRAPGPVPPPQPVVQAAVQPPGPSDPDMPRRRIEILKSLDRYQTLLADAQITKNKDDAQFQIARIVLEELRYPVKAVAEFRKVIGNFPQSDQAASAQLEIGKSLLALGKIEDARKELLKVPAVYPNSPLADKALYQVGQSFEQQAQRLAGVSAQVVKAEMFQMGQQAAYGSYQKANEEQEGRLAARRAELKKGGKEQELALDEAYNASRFGGMSSAGISNIVRQAEVQAETESALQVANRQDRINEAYRQAVAAYAKAAADYPLGSTTGSSLEHMAVIYEVHLKDPAAAMTTYQRVVQLFPGTPVAENAALKVARFHEQQGKYDLAVNDYRDFIRTYPASSQVADAQYSLAEALEQQGRWVEAMDAYQTFREKFANNPKAAKALEQIQWIKAYRK